jgi:hypothetical protein
MLFWQDIRSETEIDLGIIFLVLHGQPCCPPLDRLHNDNEIHSIALSIGTNFTGAGTPPKRDQEYEDTYASAWGIVNLICL